MKEGGRSIFLASNSRRLTRRLGMRLVGTQREPPLLLAGPESQRIGLYDVRKRRTASFAGLRRVENLSGQTE
jgi:hypothetical protein